MKIWTQSILAISVTAGLFSDTLAEDYDGRDLLSRVIENRLAIQTWHVRLLHSRSGITASGHEILEQEFYSDGLRSRTDSIHLDRSGRQGLRDPEYTNYLIQTESERISFSTREYLTGETSALSVNPVERHDAAAVFDVRGIGLHAQGIHFGSHPTEFYQGADIAITGCQAEELHGMPTVKVTVVHASGSQMAMWVAVEQGPSPIRIEVTGSSGTEETVPMRARTDVQIRKWEPSGIWFPERLVYEEFMDGELLLHEETDVDVVALNGTLDDSLFAIGGIGVPAGTAVYKTPDSEHANLLWDGEKIITSDARYTPLPGAEPRLQSTRQWVLLLNAFVLSMLCVICFWRYLAKRKPNR